MGVHIVADEVVAGEVLATLSALRQIERSIRGGSAQATIDGFDLAELTEDA